MRKFFKRHYFAPISGPPKTRMLYEDPVYLQYDPQKIVAGFEAWQPPIPEEGHLVTIEALGGSARVLVEQAESRESEETGVLMLWIVGRMVK